MTKAEHERLLGCAESQVVVQCTWFDKSPRRAANRALSISVTWAFAISCTRPGHHDGCPRLPSLGGALPIDGGSDVALCRALLRVGAADAEIIGARLKGRFGHEPSDPYCRGLNAGSSGSAPSDGPAIALSNLIVWMDHRAVAAPLRRFGVARLHRVPENCSYRSTAPAGSRFCSEEVARGGCR